MMNKNNKEEFTVNHTRDWILFVVSTVFMIALLIWIPEWIWVSWPFVFTSLAGAMGRL